MPPGPGDDEERRRRRLGDATKGRIADLAAGWTIEPGAAPPAEADAAPEPPPAPRPAPPPPPRAQAATLPPAPPPPRAPVVAAGPPRRPSQIRSGPTETGTVDVSGVIAEPRAPEPAEEQLAPPPRAAPPRPPPTRARPPTTAPPPPPAPAARPPRAGFVIEPAVPVGEFDSSALTEIEPDKQRIAHEQATIVRDAASALLQVAESPPPPEPEPEPEPDPEPSARAASRDDPTSIDRDETGVSAPGDAGANARQGTVRPYATLRRKRGVLGDLRYVATAYLGVRRARRELGRLAQTQAGRQLSRRRHLVTLGRTAATADGFSHEALAAAGDSLDAIEARRTRHAGAVTTADGELKKVARDREAAASRYAADVAALDAEIADTTTKLRPLAKEAGALARRVADLREALHRADARILVAESQLAAARAGQQSKLDPAALQAELATHRADRKAIQREEPEIAALLDALNPKIAALEGARSEAVRRRAEVEAAERTDHVRTAELLTAIGAQRIVVDRAAGDAETERDKLLFELGERLYVDRPASMTYELSPIDAIDVELGTTDRRMMELRELMSSLDRWKLARGIAMIVLLVAGLAALLVWRVAFA